MCLTEGGDYENSKPLIERVAKVNHLFESGHTIKIFTARGSKTGLDWTALTKSQLLKWNVKHHELIIGKPDTDVFIDDKAINSEHFNWEIDL